MNWLVFDKKELFITEHKPSLTQAHWIITHPLNAEAAQRLLDETYDLVERYVHTDSPDERLEADSKIAETIAAFCDDAGARYAEMDAEDWIGGAIDDLGITKDTTDDQLESIAAKLRAEAKKNQGLDELVGLDEYLEQLRSA